MMKVRITHPDDPAPLFRAEDWPESALPTSPAARLGMLLGMLSEGIIDLPTFKVLARPPESAVPLTVSLGEPVGEPIT